MTVTYDASVVSSPHHSPFRSIRRPGGRVLRIRWRSIGFALLAVLAVGGALLLAAAGGDAGDERTIVWAVGDGANGSSVAKELAGRMDQDELDAFLYLGDVYETGSAAEFESNYASVYGRFDEVAEPTPGNHEWPSHEEGYDPYWTEVKGRPQPSYYATELAGWEILSLNSEDAHDPKSAQIAWLRDQLSEPGTCRIAFWHRPRYSAGDTHGDQPDVEPFWSALEGHAAIVVNGHEHNSQRFPPKRGITELLAGAGGNELYSLVPGDDRPAFANDTDYAALRLELEPELARYRFVAVDGTLLDEGAMPCER